MGKKELVLRVQFETSTEDDVAVAHALDHVDRATLGHLSSGAFLRWLLDRHTGHHQLTKASPRSAASF